MIDTHCHLVPGVDDGPADLVEALELARALVGDGVSAVVCTPTGEISDYWPKHSGSTKALLPCTWC